MKEIGIVKKTAQETASVEINKKEECSKCGMCMFPKNARSMEVIAINEIGAKEEDQVIVEIKDKGKMLGMTLVFVVPLLLLCLAIGLNYFFIKNELIVLIMGVGAVVLWYVILSFIDKKLKTTKKYGTEIIQILKKEK
ncbi:MAG: SoxR reducing system RseC family protein [Clostridia bacterium]|nr:SoxR reducing system RseC family protein [Clostridia bacterium]